MSVAVTGAPGGLGITDGQWVRATGDYANTRFSHLDQINASNVTRSAWPLRFPSGCHADTEALPRVVNNTMYTSRPIRIACMRSISPGHPYRGLSPGVRFCIHGVAAASHHRLERGGFLRPESLLYDAGQTSFWFPTCNAPGSNHDAAGPTVQGARRALRRGVNLRGELAEWRRARRAQGMTLRDRVLWVADINVLRGFHRTTGKPVGIIELTAQGAILLNDVATGSGGGSSRPTMRFA